MNTASLALNGLLLVAIAVLYILWFTQDTDSTGGDAGQPSFSQVERTSGDAPAIAFVNSDVLLEKYELVGKLARQLESDSRKKDTDLASRQEELESEAAYFQESVQNQSLNEASAQRIYEQLMAKQQEIYQLQEQYASELAQKEFEMNMTLLDSVRNYLHRMNIDNKYDFILNYNASGSILQAGNNFDITDIVLEGLNREYTTKYEPQE